MITQVPKVRILQSLIRQYTKRGGKRGKHNILSPLKSHSIIKR